MNMRHLIFQVKEKEIEPCHYLKCPADGRYEAAEQSDMEIQRFLMPRIRSWPQSILRS